MDDHAKRRDTSAYVHVSSAAGSVVPKPNLHLQSKTLLTNIDITLPELGR